MKGHNYGLCLKCGKVHIHHWSDKPKSDEHKKRIRILKSGIPLSNLHKKHIQTSHLRGKAHPLYNHDVFDRMCGYCGELFRPRPSKMTGNKGKYCSRECLNSSKRKIDVICAYCKKSFKVHPSKIKDGKGKYCSHECVNLDRTKTIDVICTNCNKIITIPTWKLKKGQKRVFCNKDCEAKYNIGENNPFYGRNHEDETKSRMILHHWSHNKGFFDILKISKEEWLLKSRTAQNIRPTKPEKIMIDIIDKHNLPFKYVGDGKLAIGGLNPDFVDCDGLHKIIEVFGDYWHCARKDIEWKYTETGRKTTLDKYGYDTLIIWEHELKETGNEINIVEKILQFVKGSHK